MITLHIGPRDNWPESINKIVSNYNLADVWRCENATKPLTMLEAKNIQRFASTSPVAKQKVIILEGLEQYRVDVLNTFLKLFEEPPNYLEIELFSENEHILPTIKSRVQRLKYLADFANIKEEDVWQRAFSDYKKKPIERTESLLYLSALSHSQVNQEKLLESYLKK